VLPPLFIIGSARSGTTILGEIFENNTQCVFFHEIDVWDRKSYITDQGFFEKLKINLNYFIRQNIPKNNKLLVMLRIIQFNLLMILQELHIIECDRGHQLTEKDVTPDMLHQVDKVISSAGDKRLVIKNPRNSLKIPFIKKLFPNAKFLHIVRDGRDTTCSLMSGHNHKYWAFMKPPGWNEWQKNKPKGPEKYAWQWNTVINIINTDKKNLSENDFVEIRYEDFVLEPEKTMGFVFNKFGIPFEQSQINLCKKVQNKMRGSYQAGERWTVYNHSTRLGRYKENLTEEEIKKVESILGKNNKLYNYS